MHVLKPASTITSSSTISPVGRTLLDATAPPYVTTSATILPSLPFEISTRKKVPLTASTALGTLTTNSSFLPSGAVSSAVIEPLSSFIHVLPLPNKPNCSNVSLLPASSLTYLSPSSTSLT